MQTVGMPVVIHAYYLEADRVEYDTRDYVLDAEITDEFWVLEKPKDWKRIDYEITSCRLIDGIDLLGKPLVGICNVELKRTAYTDNLKSLIEGAGLDYDDFRTKCPDVTFQGMAVNCDKEIALGLKERREKYKKHMLYESLQKRVAAYREKETICGK